MTAMLLTALFAFADAPELNALHEGGVYQVRAALALYAAPDEGPVAVLPANLYFTACGQYEDAGTLWLGIETRDEKQVVTRWLVALADVQSAKLHPESKATMAARRDASMAGQGWPPHEVWVFMAKDPDWMREYERRNGTGAGPHRSVESRAELDAFAAKWEAEH